MPKIKTIRFRNYKSFKTEYSSIDMKPITVLICKNNSGKSSCIDIIEFLSKANLFKESHSEVIIDSICLKSDLIGLCESQGYSKNYMPAIDKYIDQQISFALKIKTSSSGNATYDIERLKDDKVFDNTSLDWDYLTRGLNYILNESCSINRLDAERDILPEPYSKEEKLLKNGEGACNLVNRVLNYSKHDEKLIQVKLLNELNRIMFPDSKFDGITVQKVEDNIKDEWEIYLYEGEERFPLSKTGTGLKTIILVLLNLLVIPKLNNYSDNNLKIFAFEELENNLHPALQRRLFDYIEQYVNEHKNTYVFMTTHSHIAINKFADNAKAQLLHIIKENGVSSIHKIEDYLSKCEVLSDLDVRASDLLQSNGIIWVEGPSDRVYIKRWLEIWCDCDLIEGRDYQFLYYGGRLLSHYSVKENESLINILTTNRNSAIVIDSDKRTKNAKINDTKKRIKKEFCDKGMYCWITKGKEIENYIPYQAINAAYNAKLKTQCQQFNIFPEYIEPIRKNFSSEKVTFANKVSTYIDEGNANLLDLKMKITELFKTIKKWNLR